MKRPAGEQERQERKTASFLHLHTQQVLSVDDDPVNQMVIQAMLLTHYCLLTFFPNSQPAFFLPQVLSVDDDPVNQMVIQAMLGKAGFKVLKAADGQKALDLLEESLRQGDPPHVMLLDVMMPGLSGYDVVRLVRERHPTLMLPVILVSANSREEHVVEGLQAGANDYVTKPFGRNELVARIQAQLRTREFSQGVRASLAAACQGLQQQQQQQAPQQGADGSLGWEGNRRLSLPVVERAASAPPDGLPPVRLSAPATVEAAVPVVTAAAAGAAGAAGAAEGPVAAQQPTVHELQQQLSEAQRQLAALAALQASSAAAATAAAAQLPVEEALNGRSGSGSVESGTSERLSGDVPPAAGSAPCGAHGCCQPTVSPPQSVEAVRSSD
jgi:DNA-binding response OmpR family regulator